MRLLVRMEHWGGKIIGAGRGGFFMFYCNSNKPRLYQAMKKMGLKSMKFHFDPEGAKILVNI